MKSNKTVPAIVIAVAAQSDFRTLAAELTLTAIFPRHLLPNGFESIAALPMTPSGKLDRRSLPAVHAAEEQSNYVAPQTELQNPTAPPVGGSIAGPPNWNPR
jgi:pristinamycin I synthase-3/4